MSGVTRHAQYSLGEYIRLEEYTNVKHEYLGGQIYAMAGGTPEHGAMAIRIAVQLGMQLRGRPCNVYSADVRVRVAATGLDTYPDLSVVCGAEERDPEDRNALTNPILLVEVGSPSTEEYDRGEKLEHYQKIPSLREVVLVSHREPLVELWRRDAGGAWRRLDPIGAGATVALESVGCALDVSEIYRDPLRQG